MLSFSIPLHAQLPQHHLLKEAGNVRIVPQQLHDCSKKATAHQFASVSTSSGKLSNSTLSSASPSSVKSVLPKSVAPLLPDQWDQYAPNNWMTPVVGGEHAVVGCIATAMSQVMHYWKYPAQGSGSITYDDSLGCKQILSADFSQSRYDWTNMLDKYVAGNYTEEQGRAVALLSRDCGYSVRMRYYETGVSGASAIDQARALPEYFGYDESTMLYFRDLYSRQEMTDMLKQELADGHPVLISGYNSNGGHAFVIDGYDENDWFHINLGNPDEEFDGDGWTPLDCMSPNQPAWYDVDRPEYGFNYLQIFTFTRPRTAEGATHHEPHLFAMQRMDVVDSLAQKGTPFRICLRDLANMAKVQQNDTVSLFLMKDGEALRSLYTYDRQFLLEEVDDTVYTDTLDITLPADITDGIYSLQPFFRDGGKWTEVRTCVGIPNYLLAHVSGQQVTLTQDSANYAYVTLEDFEISDLLLNAAPPQISLTIKAHNHEISGRLYILMEPLDEQTSPFYLCRQGFSLLKDEVSRRDFIKYNVWVPAMGRYRMHFLYDNSIFHDDLIEMTDRTVEVTYSNNGIFQIAKKDN